MELQTAPEAVNRFAPTKFEGVDFFNTRMWEGGPLRQMASSKVSGTFIPYDKPINGLSFAGRYVCDECKAACGGVRRQIAGKTPLEIEYTSQWVCDGCRK